MNEWLTVSGFVSTAGVAVAAMLFAIWATKRMDSLHNAYREAALVASSAKGEVTQLRAAFTDVNGQLLDERKRHQDESQLLTGQLDQARAVFAKTATPDAIRDGLTRQARAPLTPPPAPKPASDHDATTKMPTPPVKP